MERHFEQQQKYDSFDKKKPIQDPRVSKSF